MSKLSDELDQQTLTADQAGALLGRSRQWVFNLVREGWIEKQAKGQYALASVVRGAVAYYDDQIKKTSKTATASRATDARTREIELRIAERRRDLIPREDAEMAMALLAGEFNKHLDGLPAQITRDMKLRREIEAKVDGAKAKLVQALARSRELAATGRDNSSSDQEDAA